MFDKEEDEQDNNASIDSPTVMAYLRMFNRLPPVFAYLTQVSRPACLTSDKRLVLALDHPAPQPH